MFVAVSHLKSSHVHSCLIFTGKAGAYPNEAQYMSPCQGLMLFPLPANVRLGYRWLSVTYSLAYLQIRLEPTLMEFSTCLHVKVLCCFPSLQILDEGARNWHSSLFPDKAGAYPNGAYYLSACLVLMFFPLPANIRLRCKWLSVTYSLAYLQIRLEPTRMEPVPVSISMVYALSLACKC